MQSIFACRSAYLSRFASSYKMLRTAVTPDRLHLVEQDVVGSVLQRQQLGNDAVFGVHGTAQMSTPFGLISV